MSNLLPNQLEHAQEIVQFLKDHRAALASTPEITATLLPVLEIEIQAACNALEDNSSATADSKTQLRTGLRESAYHVAMGLASYADDTDDFLLQNMVDFPFAEIQRFRDNRLQQYGLTVYTKATEPTIANVLAAHHNVSEEDLTELLNNVHNFGAAMAKESGEAGTQNKVQYTGMAAINEQLNKIRRKMHTYRKTNRSLYDIWEAIDAENLEAVL